MPIDLDTTPKQVLPSSDGKMHSRFPDGSYTPPADPAAWNLPTTLSVAQDGSIGLRQYATNDDGWTISVSGLPTGVTYNSGTESLEGASTGTDSSTATFRLSKSGEIDVTDTATVTLYEAGTSPEADIFTDTFESADFNHTENGFSWSGPNRTSIVRDDGYIVHNGDPVMFGPYPESEYENTPASAGQHSLRFRFPEGGGSAEQRFFLGGEYPELWWSYWVRVPINYIHGTIGPAVRYRNQKWNAMWTNLYAGSGQPVVVCNMWDDENSWEPDGEVGTPNKSGMSYSTVSISNLTNDTSGHRSRYDNFIRFPEDQGRWMHCVHRLKVASSYGAEDGIHEWYRKWEGAADYEVLDNRHTLGLGILPDNPVGFRAGYLMGAANGGYEEDTEFLWDDIRFATFDLRY